MFSDPLVGEEAFVCSHHMFCLFSVGEFPTFEVTRTFVSLKTQRVGARTRSLCVRFTSFKQTTFSLQLRQGTVVSS